MLNAFKNRPINCDYSTNMRSTGGSMSIALPILLTRYKAYPEIKLKMVNGFRGIFKNTTMSVFTCVGLAALSKILPDYLTVRRSTIQTPAIDPSTVIENLDEFTLDWGESSRNIWFIEMTQTYATELFKELIVKKNIPTELQTLSKGIKNASEKDILFVHKAADNGIIFAVNKAAVTVRAQMISLALAYRFFVKDAEDSPEKRLLDGVSCFVADNKFEEENLNDLKNIFLTYIEQAPEYKIDLLNEMLTIYQSSLETRIQDQTSLMSTLRRDLTNYMNEVLTIQHKLEQSARELTMLQNAKGVPENVKTQYTDILDMLRSYKSIKNYGISSPLLWFTVSQPLYINSKEDWEAIEENTVRDPVIRELLHMTFIDEKFELYTKASMAYNLITGRISNYQDDLETEKDKIHHPHIMTYNCFGLYSSIIADLCSKANYTQIIEEMIEAASGLNWADSPVINDLIAQLDYISNTKRSFKTKKGTWFSMQDWRENSEKFKNE